MEEYHYFLFAAVLILNKQTWDLLFHFFYVLMSILFCHRVIFMSYYILSSFLGHLI